MAEARSPRPEAAGHIPAGSPQSDLEYKNLNRVRAQIGRELDAFASRYGYVPSQIWSPLWVYDWSEQYISCIGRRNPPPHKYEIYMPVTVIHGKVQDDKAVARA
jgi:hypothetical protein